MSICTSLDLYFEMGPPVTPQNTLVFLLYIIIIIIIIIIMCLGYKIK